MADLTYSGDGDGGYEHKGQQWVPEGTELQYYLDYGRAIQEQESYILQNQQRGYQFEDIPEGVEMTFDAGLQTGGTGERMADTAILSWNVGKAPSGSQASDLELSMKTGSEIELRDFVRKRGENSLRGLHLAAAQGDRTGIMHFMKQHGPGAPIDELDSNGCTPLMYAVMADSTQAIEMLLNFSAKREQTDAAGRTAVHYAAFFGKHRSLKFLIEAAADWNPRDVYGRTPLHWTPANRSTKCLSVLLKHASVVMGDINPPDNEGMTPLHCAAQFGRHRHIALLNQADADFTAVDVEGKTALHWTATNSDSFSILALIEAYPPLVNKKDVYKNTVLHLASDNGATHIVDTILKLNGIEVDAINDQERTALHLACMKKHPDTAQLLLTCGALDSPVDAEGLTALHYAVQNESVPALNAFSQVPDLAHLPNNEGKTPLMVAAENGSKEAVEILIKNRIVAKSVDNVETNGRSALHLAAQSGSSACVSTLVSCGADPNLLDSIQQTPLFLATEHGHGDCIQILVTGGCQPDSRDIEGQAPLHKALLHNQADSVQALVLSGADLNILDDSGSTPLHMAAYGNNSTAVHTLLENGANPNILDTSGLSPMHYAAMEGNTECLAALLAYKAYANVMDYSDERYTPLDYATLNGHTDCVDILVQAGGVSTEGIRSMAAISIQTAFRGHRTRLHFAELKKRNRAVTILARHIRGHLQRKRYQDLKRRLSATITIQAYTRGFLQRIKFKVQLSQHRAQGRHHQLMVDFGHTVARDRAASVLKTFDKEELHAPSYDLTVVGGSKEEAAKEQKLRLEAALRMRELYLEKQKRWEEFREAEHQRRIDKAKNEELDHYALIVAKSEARRNYTTVMFYQTKTVRSYNEAAGTIQRAFRRMKLHQSLADRQAFRERKQKQKMEERAARKIQKAWRRYQQYKLYQALNYKRISTSPVIALRRNPEHTSKGNEDVHSYQKDISITGNPRRKVHQTEQSGFKLFRPTTRELLFPPRSRGNVTSRQGHTHPRSDNVDLGNLLKQQVSMERTAAIAASFTFNMRAKPIVEKRTLATKLNSPRQVQSIVNTNQTTHSARDGLFPELSILKSSPKKDYRGNSKPTVHLPDIVGALNS